MRLGPASGAPAAPAPAPGRVMRVSPVAPVGPRGKKKTKEVPRCCLQNIKIKEKRPKASFRRLLNRVLQGAKVGVLGGWIAVS